MQANLIAKEYGYNYDRVLKETLTLPYQLDEILIPQNEICYHGTINEVLEKLQTNLIYLYSLTKISNNNIPMNFDKVASGKPSSSFYSASANFTWMNTEYNPISAVRPLSTFNLTQLDKLVSGKFYPERTISNYELGFFITSSYLVALTSNYDNNTIGVLVSTNKIYENSTFNFQKLNSVAFDKQNFVYVCDEIDNSIYKYNIENLILEDDIIGKKILFDDSLGGGEGTYLDKTKFKAPNFINIFENLLYVIDTGNYCLKVFDLNLNWKYTYRFKRFFESFNITSFKPNHQNNLLYFGFGQHIGIFLPNLSSTEFITMSSELSAGETIKDFCFSLEDKNIFYVITNKNIFKKTTSKPKNTIGKFLLPENNIKVQEFLFGSIDYIYDVDRFIVYGKNNNAGVFYSFLEDSNYTTILTNNDLDFYTIDEISIRPEEYAQEWVFSKALSKVLLNILALRDRIVKRFSGKYDTKGNLLYFGPLYLTDIEINKDEFDYTNNYLVNLNEVFSNSVFNRAIAKIYSFETQMLSVLRDTTLNVWPPLSTTIVVS